MTFERIEALLRAARGSGLALLEYGEGDAALRVVFAPTPTDARQAPATVAPERTGAQAEPPGINSPAVGFLRLRHPVGPALPAPGDAVAEGSVVAFVQAGPLLHPVAAPRAGVLGPPLAAEGAPLGCGTPLFQLS